MIPRALCNKLGSRKPFNCSDIVKLKGTRVVEVINNIENIVSLFIDQMTDWRKRLLVALPFFFSFLTMTGYFRKQCIGIYLQYLQDLLSEDEPDPRTK
jgi:hypothetical protein